MAGLPERLLLLALDDEKGSVVSSAAMQIEYGLAGAQLVELALAGRVDVGTKELRLVDPSPTGDELLDAALETVAASDRSRSLDHWVHKLCRGAKKQYLERLAATGLVRRERHEILGLVRFTRYPVASTSVEEADRTALRDAVLGTGALDARGTALLALVDACDLCSSFLDRSERKRAKARIEELTRGDQVGDAVERTAAAAAAAVAAAVTAATVAATASTS
ncbi:MAG TPA: GPP34 family phosphoprotein [Gaiellaceae bacterium]